MFSQRTFTLGLLLVCLILPLAEAQHYTITDLGPLAPTAINTWGQVVGNYEGYAFIWTRTGGMRNLGTLPGGIFSSAIGINDLGVVAGSADGPAIVSPLDFGSEQCSNLIQPFVWTPRGGMRTATQPIPPPTFGASNPCYSPYYATGINAHGHVVGYHTPYGTYQHAFLWTSADGITLFGGSWPPTLVNGVSNTGEMVGQNSETPDPGIGHATWWKDGTATALAELGSEEGIYHSSSANGVNDQGQVVGWSTTLPLFLDGCDPYDFATCAMHAVLWTRSGATLDLGTLPGDTLSSASKVNFFGQVIGSSGNTLVEQGWGGIGGSGFWGDGGSIAVVGRPFIWSERSGMRDLNTLIRGNSKWVLFSATDINVWGQIVGQGMLNGKPHGFLLTPRAFFKL